MTWCSVVLRVASLCYALQAGRPLVFAFGNELFGISDGLRHAAHARVRLDMRGMAQSYNVRKPEHSLNPLQTNKQRKKPRAARRNGVSVATVTV